MDWISQSHNIYNIGQKFLNGMNLLIYCPLSNFYTIQ